MPTYEYKCKVCDDRFEIEQSFSDDALTVLEGCTQTDDGDHQLKKVFSAVGISFKGDGFYRNDSRSGGSSSSTSSSSDSSSSTSSSSSGSSSSSDSGSSTSSGDSGSGGSSSSSSSSGSDSSASKASTSSSSD